MTDIVVGLGYYVFMIAFSGLFFWFGWRAGLLGFIICLISGSLLITHILFLAMALYELIF